MKTVPLYAKKLEKIRQWQRNNKDKMRSYRKKSRERKRLERLNNLPPKESFSVPGEVWRPIPDFPKYEASSLGRIRSLLFDRIRILKTDNRITNTGYETVSIRRSSGKRSMLVHRLVAAAFHGPNYQLNVNLLGPA